MSQFVGPGAVYDGTSQTCLTDVIPAYVYQEYSDDDDILSMFEAQTDFMQGFQNWFLTANLPIYTGGIVQGALLDWVGQGIYGIARPTITTGMATSYEAINDYPVNNQAINERKIISNQSVQQVDDDIYRRVITWNYYKGDGMNFTTEWMKRRVYRFLNGPNGIAPTITNTYSVSASVSASEMTISATGSDPDTGSLLNSLIGSGACATPFLMTFSVSATA